MVGLVWLRLGHGLEIPRTVAPFQAGGTHRECGSHRRVPESGRRDGAVRNPENLCFGQGLAQLRPAVTNVECIKAHLIRVTAGKRDPRNRANGVRTYCPEQPNSEKYCPPDPARPWGWIRTTAHEGIWEFRELLPLGL